MKIKPEHFQYIKASLLSVLKEGKLQNIEGTPTIIEAIEMTKKNLISRGLIEENNPARCFLWNWFYSVIDSNWVCDEIYPYANDDHLKTVLAQIVNKLEPLTKDLLK
jgi:hypothetical protein